MIENVFKYVYALKLYLSSQHIFLLFNINKEEENLK